MGEKNNDNVLSDAKHKDISMQSICCISIVTNIGCLYVDVIMSNRAALSKSLNRRPGTEQNILASSSDLVAIYVMTLFSATTSDPNICVPTWLTRPGQHSMNGVRTSVDYDLAGCQGQCVDNPDCFAVDFDTSTVRIRLLTGASKFLLLYFCLSPHSQPNYSMICDHPWAPEVKVVALAPANAPPTGIGSLASVGFCVKAEI